VRCPTQNKPGEVVLQKNAMPKAEKQTGGMTKG